MSRLKLSRDSGFPGRKIGTTPSISGRLDTLHWVFLGGEGWGPGACSPGKKSKFEVFKLLEMH